MIIVELRIAAFGRLVNCYLEKTYENLKIQEDREISGVYVRKSPASALQRIKSRVAAETFSICTP